LIDFFGIPFLPHWRISIAKNGTKKSTGFNCQTRTKKSDSEAEFLYLLIFFGIQFVN
jgi:hypothetical protein